MSWPVEFSGIDHLYFKLMYAKDNSSSSDAANAKVIPNERNQAPGRVGKKRGKANHNHVLE